VRVLQSLAIQLTARCSMGYSLNQKGLFKNLLRDNKTKLKVTQGERIAGRTEEEIFAALGVKMRSAARSVSTVGSDQMNRPPNERLP
jgi:hypothetical protein